MPLFLRSLKTLLKSWIDLTIAGLLLYYCDIRWFYMFCMVEWIVSHAAWNDYKRSQVRAYQIGNECKLLAIMEKVGATLEDSERIFEREFRDKMDETQFKSLQTDFRIIGA